MKQSIFLFATALLLLAAPCCFSQAGTANDLYLQTSEMNNTMVQYDADKTSILRFYSTNPSSDDWWNPRDGNEYNSPERRRRLLELIAVYRKQMEALDFDKMNINGKVDYLLFKRNLDDEQYKLEQEQKTYLQVTAWFPFADSIYALERPRKRGAVVNGQEVARQLEGIRKQIIRDRKSVV